MSETTTASTQGTEQEQTRTDPGGQTRTARKRPGHPGRGHHAVPARGVPGHQHGPDRGSGLGVPNRPSTSSSPTNRACSARSSPAPSPRSATPWPSRSPACRTALDLEARPARPGPRAARPGDPAQDDAATPPGDRRSRPFPELGRLFYDSGPRRTIDTLAATFESLAARGTLRLQDPRLTAEHFNWLVISTPLNRVMLCGDTGLPPGPRGPRPLCRRRNPGLSRRLRRKLTALRARYAAEHGARWVGGGQGGRHTPLHFEFIAHRGACGKTPVVSENSQPGLRTRGNGSREMRVLLPTAVSA